MICVLPWGWLPFSLVQVSDDVFEDVVVFSRESAKHVLHGVETMLSIIDFCRGPRGNTE